MTWRSSLAGGARVALVASVLFTPWLSACGFTTSLSGYASGGGASKTDAGSGGTGATGGVAGQGGTGGSGGVAGQGGTGAAGGVAGKGGTGGSGGVAGQGGTGATGGVAGKGGTGGSGGVAGQGGAAASGGVAGQGGTGATGGTQSTGGTGGVSGQVVACGTSTCKVGTDFCCDFNNGKPPACNPLGTTCYPSTDLYCDGPEDCPSGDVCCGQIVTVSGGGYEYNQVQCAATCNSNQNQRVFCHSNADCTGAQLCRPSTILAGYTACG